MQSTVQKVSAEQHLLLCRKPNSKHGAGACAYCRQQAERLAALYGQVKR
jgi:hypothetical protein